MNKRKVVGENPIWEVAILGNEVAMVKDYYF